MNGSGLIQYERMKGKAAMERDFELSMKLSMIYLERKFYIKKSSRTLSLILYLNFKNSKV